MCTVNFIARRNGYALGMNRDEKLARAAALPPAQRQIDRRAVLFPSEPGGGTWIGVNDAGVTLALINWYFISKRIDESPVSRGSIVRSVLSATSPAAVDAAFAGLPLDRINPFRLLGFFPTDQTVVEWRWDLKSVAQLHHLWRTNIWASSGHDEPGAQQTRGKIFNEALLQSSSGNLNWLRRLHRSHGLQPGPHSICMHRNGAATVSYTEVSVSRRTATMRYQAGPPCCSSRQFVYSHELQRVESSTYREDTCNLPHSVEAKVGLQPAPRSFSHFPRF
jgi:hypothetical protein